MGLSVLWTWERPPFGPVTRAFATLLATSVCACGSIGPATVPRDRSDYSAAIGDSWKQQTLLNIIKLRYGDFPMFVEIAQVIAGYQLQTSAAAGVSIQNYLTNAINVSPAIGGTAGVGATYVDRPTVIYAPLTGTEFIKKLLTPIPPTGVLFLLQSGYSARLVLPVTVDSINGVSNESRRPGMRRGGDPAFARLAELLYELQQANALQIRVERAKDGSADSILTFPPESPELTSKVAEIRRILRLSGASRSHNVFYGGYSGNGRDISIVTRSMLQIMIELGALAHVPQADITSGRAAPGSTVSGPTADRPLLRLNIESGGEPPTDAFVTVPYKGRWFWIPDTDLASKNLFSALMLLFSISDVGVKSAPPVVTVPAN